MQPNGRNTSADGLHTDETMGWLRRTTIDPPRRHMHCANSEERPGIPGGIDYEIAAKLKFCLAIGDHTVLGLRDMSAETDQVQWSTKYRKWGKGRAFFHQS